MAEAGSDSVENRAQHFRLGMYVWNPTAEIRKELSKIAVEVTIQSHDTEADVMRIAEGVHEMTLQQIRKHFRSEEAQVPPEMVPVEICVD